MQGGVRGRVLYYNEQNNEIQHNRRDCSGVCCLGIQCFHAQGKQRPEGGSCQGAQATGPGSEREGRGDKRAGDNRCSGNERLAGAGRGGEPVVRDLGQDNGHLLQGGFHGGKGSVAGQDKRCSPAGRTAQKGGSVATDAGPCVPSQGSAGKGGSEQGGLPGGRSQPLCPACRDRRCEGGDSTDGIACSLLWCDRFAPGERGCLCHHTDSRGNADEAQSSEGGVQCARALCRHIARRRLAGVYRGGRPDPKTSPRVCLRLSCGREHPYLHRACPI